MAQEDMIMMSRNELQHLHIIQKVLEGVVTQNEASQMLCLSDRQIRRIVHRVKTEGEQGVVHRSRGKPSNRKTLQLKTFAWQFPLKYLVTIRYI